MACPFFDPTDPIPWSEWPNPPWLPLGDPYRGICTATRSPAPQDLLRSCCNMGYAKGACPQLPDSDGPDSVRFSILSLESARAQIRYVRERDHHPFGTGMLTVEPAPPATDLLDRQAQAVLASYLRRK